MGIYIGGKREREVSIFVFFFLKKVYNCSLFDKHFGILEG